MKGVLVIIDGLGDRPCNSLGGKTPLEAAEIPNIDFLGEKSVFGSIFPVNKDFVPGTNEAFVAYLEGQPLLYERGPLEALGSDMNFQKGDLALRTNFATIKVEKSLGNAQIIDRRAGRNLTYDEVKQLTDSINKGVKVQSKFEFKNTLQHRGILLFEGGFSDNISSTDPELHSRYKKSEFFKFSEPLDEDDDSQYSANLVNDFTEKSYNILKDHPVNKLRKQRGFLPANILLCRGAGNSLPTLKKRRKWLCVSDVPLIKGLARVSEMTLFSYPYPKLTKLDAYKNLYQGLEKTIKMNLKYLKKYWKKFNYALVYFKETDSAGHDNKPLDKKKMIELIDKKFFSFIRKKIKKEQTKIAVTADHSTPCSLKGHSADPVPLLLYTGKESDSLEFSEKEAGKGTLGELKGSELLKKIDFK